MLQLACQTHRGQEVGEVRVFTRKASHGVFMATQDIGESLLFFFFGRLKFSLELDLIRLLVLFKVLSSYEVSCICRTEQCDFL